MNINTLRSDIEKKKLELESLENLLIKEKMRIITPAHELAIGLHDIMCKWNHTDGCSWYYEYSSKENIHDWNGSSHLSYLNKADILISTFSNMDWKELLSIISTAYKN